MNLSHLPIKETLKSMPGVKNFKAVANETDKQYRDVVVGQVFSSSDDEVLDAKWTVYTAAQELTYFRGQHEL